MRPKLALSTDTSSANGFDRHWRAVLMITMALTAVRMVALFATPLELYPDEAQYWLWSRTLDWGYYSKPPVVAWLIWATTSIGGDAEPWVRFSAPLLHAITTFCVYGIGRRLYGPSTGFAAAALYLLMPAVQLSSVVAATDAPLLMFLSLALLAYVELPAGDHRRRLWLAAGFGAATGLAFLSKYAAVYGLIGLALHLALSKPARTVWTLKSAGLAALAFLVILAPNLAWNAAHGFSTVQHTAANAAWGGRQLFNFGELGEFLASQFGVFGPIPFAVLIGGAAVLAARRRLEPADVLLLCFALPAVLIVTGQAFISRANANWSGAGYAPGVILAAAWLVRWRARWWLMGALALQAAVAAVFLACVLQPSFAETIGLSNAFKRAKGWEQMTEAMANRALREPPKSLSAVAVNDRFLFNAAAYYGRDYFGRNGEPPLKMWVREAHPQNQAETVAPLTAADGGRVLAVSLEQVFIEEMKADFRATSDEEIVSIRLDNKRKRKAELFIAEGFDPAPRDPVTGKPIPRRP
ncbi:glycosyltransferase family 39 protein [Phenylobacterium sp.]|uniref:ArnT family glycosyltransferase n=1 Tax=Phenylobacterium sp. TaxID=1871053 RepID=UPI002899EF8D|nr:glycosyltransferase family 39 protein [Phenylobacterium sp.]